MSMRGGGGSVGQYGKMRTRIGGGDAAAQKAENAQAPKIPDLLARIGSLFRPYRTQLGITIVLVLVGAALSVAPPLLTQQAFDRGLFPDEGRSLPDVPVLIELVGLMVALWVASSALGVW